MSAQKLVPVENSHLSLHFRVARKIRLAILIDHFQCHALHIFLEYILFRLVYAIINVVFPIFGEIPLNDRYIVRAFWIYLSAMATIFNH